MNTCIHLALLADNDPGLRELYHPLCVDEELTLPIHPLLYENGYHRATYTWEMLHSYYRFLSTATLQTPGKRVDQQLFMRLTACLCVTEVLLSTQLPRV